METDDLLTFPAAERNREPILDVLREVLPERGVVLEVASGTGQHAVAFARALPGLVWQPSDPEPKHREAIAARVKRAGLGNLRPPVDLDVHAEPWPVGELDAVFVANLLHIAPESATGALLEGAAARLRAAGALVVYGPFRVDGECTTESNARFEDSLRARDPRWGLRDTRDVVAAAAAQGLVHVETRGMPANNFVLVFRKAGRGG